MERRPVTSLLAGLWLVVTWPGTEAQSACPSNWTSVNQSCFTVISTPLTWFEAQATCRVLGANLATISNSSQNDAVMAVMQAAGEYHAWIGLHDLVKVFQFQWVEGQQPVTFTRWAPLQPDNFKGLENCVVLRRELDNWNDAHCRLLEASVCQMVM